MGVCLCGWRSWQRASWTKQPPIKCSLMQVSWVLLCACCMLGGFRIFVHEPIVLWLILHFWWAGWLMLADAAPVLYTLALSPAPAQTCSSKPPPLSMCVPCVCVRVLQVSAVQDCSKLELCLLVASCRLQEHGQASVNFEVRCIAPVRMTVVRCCWLICVCFLGKRPGMRPFYSQVAFLAWRSLCVGALVRSGRVTCWAVYQQSGWTSSNMGMHLKQVLLLLRCILTHPLCLSNPHPSKPPTHPDGVGRILKAAPGAVGPHVAAGGSLARLPGPGLPGPAALP
jgi:hypothetical protein